MPRITKVYTRTGDDGTTGLGSGQRVAKDALRIEAYGDVDELNSFLGTALACGLDERLVRAFTPIQNELFHLGADLCIPEQDKERHRGPTIEARHVEELEELMDELSEELPPPSRTSSSQAAPLGRPLSTSLGPSAAAPRESSSPWPVPNRSGRSWSPT